MSSCNAANNTWDLIMIDSELISKTNRVNYKKICRSSLHHIDVALKLEINNINKVLSKVHTGPVSYCEMVYTVEINLSFH